MAKTGRLLISLCLLLGGGPQRLHAAAPATPAAPATHTTPEPPVDSTGAGGGAGGGEGGDSGAAAEPGSAQAVRSEADRLYDEGRLAAALATYQKLLAAFPRYAERAYVETMVRTCDQRLQVAPEPPRVIETPAQVLAPAEAAPAPWSFRLKLETPTQRLLSIFDFELSLGDLEISESGFRWTDAAAPERSFFIPIEDVTRVTFHAAYQCHVRCNERSWLKLETAASVRIFDDSSFETHWSRHEPTNETLAMADSVRRLFPSLPFHVATHEPAR